MADPKESVEPVAMPTIGTPDCGDRMEWLPTVEGAPAAMPQWDPPKGQ